jgi:hypothetical protein
MDQKLETGLSIYFPIKNINLLIVSLNDNLGKFASKLYNTDVGNQWE